MSQREHQKATSRKAIVQSAATLMRQSGVAGTSVPASMRGAGLTQGAFYAHFDNKNELVSEAFESAMSDAGVLIEDAADGLTGTHALAAIADQYLSAEHRNQPEIGCPLPGLTGEAATNKSEHVSELLTRGTAVMIDRLQSATNGAVTSDTLTAAAILMIGGQVVARAIPDTQLSDDVLRSSRGAVAQLAYNDAAEAQQ